MFLQDEFPDLNIIENIISQNTTLAGEVVKISNEPQFLKPRLSSVHSIKDALTVIGYNRLQNLLTGVGVIMEFKNRGISEVIDFNLNVAKIASELTQYTDDIKEDVAYLAGLFHNAGTLLFASKYDDYDKLFLSSLKFAYRAPLLEEKKYETSHTIAGMLVAKKWELDKFFNQIILLHHQKDLSKIENNQVRTLIALIQIAIALVTQTLFKDYSSDEVDLMLKNACEELMIEEDYLDEFRSVLISE
ncbi:MAG: HDOD domain-containing protein [Pseudomonadota bacterium]|nr:HDOD domain-containing protein [Pseudomonadota bacterium]